MPIKYGNRENLILSCVTFIWGVLAEGTVIIKMANIRPLSETLQRIAIDELNEVPERIEDDIEALKSWIRQQPHLRARTDDQLLLAFLRGCKYSLEKSKSKIDRYYMLRSKFPETFTLCNVDEPKIRELIRIGVSVVLPTPLNEDGPRIVFMRNGCYPPDRYSPQEVMRVGQAINEILLREDDHAIVNGLVYILDMQHLTKEHILQMTPSMIKTMVVYSEEALPFRPKATHFINVPSIFFNIFNIFKSFMSEKLISRMSVHGSDWDKLYESVPRKYLPKEYGGENGSIAELIVEWEEKFLSYRDYFMDDAKYGTDEDLRPGPPIDFDGLFGVEGSFRQLNVD